MQFSDEAHELAEREDIPVDWAEERLARAKDLVEAVQERQS